MGAQLWYHETPWHANPDAALKALQARFLAENYDLAALLPQHLAFARQSVSCAEREGDPYELLDIYQDQVTLLERLCDESIPENPEAQIEIVRRINAISGQGIGNVLDVIGVAEKRNVQKAERLTEQMMASLVGPVNPRLSKARNAVDKINEGLGRGECICFPFYDEGNPLGWYFVGNTID